MAAFVAGLGTGGTLMGVGRRLREELGDAVKIVAAEPMQGEPVQGLRSLDDGFIPPIIDLSLLDRKIFVTNHDAIVWTKKLLDEEGIFAGVSTGAIASIAVRIANEMDEGNIVFIVCDDGWKYLSSGLYTSPSKSSRTWTRRSGGNARARAARRRRVCCSWGAGRPTSPRSTPPRCGASSCARRSARVAAYPASAVREPACPRVARAWNGWRRWPARPATAAAVTPSLEAALDAERVALQTPRRGRRRARGPRVARAARRR